MEAKVSGLFPRSPHLFVFFSICLCFMLSPFSLYPRFKNCCLSLPVFLSFGSVISLAVPILKKKNFFSFLESAIKHAGMEAKEHGN